MGTRGPLKKAPALSVVPVNTAGTAAALVKPRAPQKPDRVKKDPVMSQVWDEIVPNLDSAGMVAPMDAPALEMFVRHVASAIRANDAIEDYGVYKLDGSTSVSPEVRAWISESKMVLEYAKQFGLTFASRARTVTTPDESSGTNPFAATS